MAGTNEVRHRHLTGRYGGSQFERLTCRCWPVRDCGYRQKPSFPANGPCGPVVPALRLRSGISPLSGVRLHSVLSHRAR
jgi:hypothetical protein